MNYCDTRTYYDTIIRLSEKDDIRRSNIIDFTNLNVLDYKCIHSGFLLQIKGKTKICHGISLNVNYNGFFKEDGIIIYNNLSNIVQNNYDIITLFQVFKKDKNIVEELINIKKYLKKNGQIIIEVPNMNDAMLTMYNCNKYIDYYKKEENLQKSPNNILWFFNKDYLKETILKAGFKNIKIIGIQRKPLSNHLWWLSKGRDTGEYIWNWLDNDEYEKNLIKFDKTDTLLAIVQI